MYIKRVVLENLRGFRQLAFDFERPDGRSSCWAVINGHNAPGKTSFVKAIVLALVGTAIRRGRCSRRCPVARALSPAVTQLFLRTS